MQTAVLKQIVHALFSSLELEGEALYLLRFAPSAAVRKGSEKVVALCQSLDVNAQAAQEACQQASQALARTAPGNSVAVAVQRLALLLELQFRGNRDVVAMLFPETLQTVLSAITEAFSEVSRKTNLGEVNIEEDPNSLTRLKVVEARALAASAMLLTLSEAVAQS
jgi:hypothetical protein